MTILHASEYAPLKGICMKKRVFISLLCIILAIVTIPSPSAVRAIEYGGLHSIYELNTEEYPLDDHAGETHLSTLEVDWRNSYRIDNEEFITEGSMWYPRIKRLSDGSYMLFFQDGRWGPNVYCTYSENGTDWEKPTLLFGAHLTYNDTYMRNYATVDAIQLENGDIIIAAIFQAVRKDASSPAPSRFLMTEKGIVTKYSTDGGRTWSEQQIVYHGRCWEPSFLQLPNGTVQMYFTHSAPKDAIYGSLMGNNVSSGVAMLTSTDNGRTWSPMALTYPYVAKRIVQQNIYVYNGINILTDQMPVAILLHDNKTIVMATESLRPDKSGHSTSIIRSHDYFARTLAENEDGPEDRDNFITVGAGPYIDQFPSGEIALSMSAGAKPRVYLGNETGTKFYLDRYFSAACKQKRSAWGDVFVTSSHTLMATSEDTIPNPTGGTVMDTSGLGITRMVLNHRINAKTASMTVDGITSDWFDNTDALFAGSINQAQVSVRAAHDSENIYFLLEHLDYDITQKDRYEVNLSTGSSTITVYADTTGITDVKRTKGSGAAITGYTSATKVYGSIDNGKDSDEGFVIEFSIPKEYFTDDDLRILVKMFNVDGVTEYAWDGFNGLNVGDTSTWHIIRLVDNIALTEHEYYTSWSKNRVYHWKDCTVCDNVKEKAEHIFDGNDVCTVCQYELSPVITIEANVKSKGSITAPVIADLLQDGKVKHSFTLKGNDIQFVFEDVPYGEYTLRISKSKHVTREYAITTDNDRVKIDAIIRLYGDVNGDGSINAADATQIKRYFNNKNSVFTSLTGEELEYLIIAADVNKDGKANASDATQIKRYYNNKTSVFINIE